MNKRIFKKWENQLKKILGIKFNPLNDAVELLFFEYEKSIKNTPYSNEILDVIKNIQKIQIRSNKK